MRVSGRVLWAGFKLYIGWKLIWQPCRRAARLQTQTARWLMSFESLIGVTALLACILPPFSHVCVPMLVLATSPVNL